MSRRWNYPLWGSRGTLALLCLIGVAAAVHVWVPYEPVAIPFYAAPVLFGAGLFGRRGGVTVLMLVTGVIVGIATLVRPVVETGTLERVLTLGAWAGFGLVVAWVVGTLRERLRRRNRELTDAHLAFRDALAQLVLTTAGQADERLCRVADLSVAVAGALGLDQRARDEVQAAAMLSAFATSDTTLGTIARAAGVRYTGRGKNRGAPVIADDDGFLERVAGMLSCARERWDGTGRLGLQGEAIPAGARIVATTIVYDVAAYGTGATPIPGGVHVAGGRLRAGRGTQFDPSVVDMLLKVQTADEAAAESVRRAS